MTARNSERRPLTALQRAILDFFWSRGPATAEQVRAGLAPAYHLKDSTIRTLLRRLEERRFLTHTVDGKLYVYRATARRTSVAARAVQQIIDQFWSGSPEQFLVGMVDENVVSADVIKRLAKKVGK